MYSVLLTLLIDTVTTYSCNFLLLCILKAFNFFFGLYTVLMICMHIYVYSTEKFYFCYLLFFSHISCFYHYFIHFQLWFWSYLLLSWLSELSCTYKLHNTLICISSVQNDHLQHFNVKYCTCSISQSLMSLHTYYKPLSTDDTTFFWFKFCQL